MKNVRTSVRYIVSYAKGDIKATDIQEEINEQISKLSNVEILSTQLVPSGEGFLSTITYKLLSSAS